MTRMEEPRSLDHLLSQVCRLHYKRGRSRLRALGLHRGQPPLLIILSEEEGRTHSELAARLHVTPPTVSKMLQRMEKAGFVERKADPDDHRISRVYLTPLGRKTHENLQRVLEEFDQETFVGLNSEERSLLQKCLFRIRENLAQIVDEESCCHE